MSKIKMIKTTTGAVDGISIRKFSEGMVYSTPYQISEYLCELFLKSGVAKVARERNIYEKSEPTEPMKSPEMAVVEPKEIKKTKEVKELKEEPKKTIQIFMLADELNVPNKEIIKVAKSFNIGVKNHMSVLSEEEVITIKESLK